VRLGLFSVALGDICHRGHGIFTVEDFLQLEVAAAGCCVRRAQGKRVIFKVVEMRLTTCRLEHRNIIDRGHNEMSD
jgi:hypothetical protein